MFKRFKMFNENKKKYFLIFTLTLLNLLTLLNAWALQPEQIFLAMEAEMNRAMGSLQFEDYPKPYLIRLRLTGEETRIMDFRAGRISYEMKENSFHLIPDVRVGDHRFDQSPDSWRDTEPRPVSLADERSLRHYLWSSLDEAYKNACALFLSKRAQRSAEGAPDYATDDLTEEESPVYLDQNREEGLPDAYGKMLERLSSELGGIPEASRDLIKLEDTLHRAYYADTKGAKVFQKRRILRVYLSLYGQSLRGLPLHITRSFHAGTPEELPEERVLREAVFRMKKEFKELRSSGEAKGGLAPCVLDSQASAQLFAAFAQRLEGERQRDPNEPQTFRSKIGGRVLPSFLTLLDDPSLREHRGVRLLGSYAYDEEGVAPKPVKLIENGVLRDFLLSRRPVKGMSANSNGHGRAGPAHAPHARMGSLIVSSSKALSRADLKRALLDEVKKRKLPFGIWVEGLEPSRQPSDTGAHQTFRGAAIRLKRIQADGSETLLHHGEIVGTPLKLMQSILATGDDDRVHNFLSNGAGGPVPVSVSSPALLISEIEIQKGSARPARLPILSSPLKEE